MVNYREDNFDGQGVFHLFILNFPINFPATMTDANTDANNTPLLENLRNAVGGDNVLSGSQLTARDNGYWDPSPLRCTALVTPRSSEQVARVLRLCHSSRQPLVVQGGLTGTVRGQDAHPGEIALSLEKMTAIKHFDPVGKTLAVEAGCTLEAVQTFARQHNLLFPVDIGARGSCTIGGNLATNAGGMEVLRYGMMRQHALGIEAVLADGARLDAMNTLQKNNTGFDLKQLLIGSEGTLGIITAATLQLRPLPSSCDTAFVACRNFNQVTTLMDSAQRQLGDNLTRLELMDGRYYSLLTGAGGNPPPVARECPWYVLVEAMGFAPARDGELFASWLESRLAADGLADAAIAGNLQQRQAMWKIREVFDVAVAAKPFFMYDVSLPLHAMADYVHTVRTAINRAWPDALFFTVGHVADGNLHFFLSPRASGDTQSLQATADAIIYQPLADIGGSISAEHGIGLEKKRWLHLCRSTAEIDTMRALKKLLDPHNILNPGRIFDMPGCAPTGPASDTGPAR